MTRDGGPRGVGNGAAWAIEGMAPEDWQKDLLAVQNTTNLHFSPTDQSRARQETVGLKLRRRIGQGESNRMLR